MRRIALIIASIGVSAFFLWLALKDVEIPVIAATLKQIDIRWLGLCVISSTCGIWARSMRWRGLLGFRLSRITSFRIWNITLLLNQMPLRTGEVARSLLAANEDVPLVITATSIIVERLLDTLVVVALLAATLNHLPSASGFATGSASVFGVGAVLGFSVLILLARYPDSIRL